MNKKQYVSINYIHNLYKEEAIMRCAAWASSVKPIFLKVLKPSFSHNKCFSNLLYDKRNISIALFHHAIT